MSIGIALLLAAYVFSCLFILYFCVIADPATSDIAYHVTIVLPNKIWLKLSHFLGEKRIRIVEAILERALVAVYLAVVLGCWTVVFWFIYPWISESPHVSNVHQYIGILVFFACFGSWRLTNTTSPGIITARSFPRYNHYPYDHLLFLPDRRCETTNLIRIARSKFDRLRYNQNVPRYDHFCGWVYNTIGEENYRWFLLFLTVHVLMCFYGSYVIYFLFRGEIIQKNLLHLTFFDRSTGETFQSNWFIVVQYLFVQKLWEAGALAIMFVMGIALSGFLGYHIWLTSKNMTTNEAQKWGDIQSWHKKEMKKYKDAVKRGEIQPSANETTQQSGRVVELNDGDVNCTGGIATSGSGSQQPQTPAQAPEPRIIDPGPMPKNIYDRGFVENWKEVLFPISLRKENILKKVEGTDLAPSRSSTGKRTKKQS